MHALWILLNTPAIMLSLVLGLILPDSWMEIAGLVVFVLQYLAYLALCVLLTRTLVRRKNARAVR